ncbi:MAG: NAD(P)-dependent alcohol dehydrogenase [bacterium]
MKAWEIRDAFGLDHLVRAERAEPALGFGQVRLAMKAASLNFRDSLMVRGAYNPKQKLPLIPCSDGVGVVVEVGAGVTRVKVGDRVCPIFAQRWLGGEPTHEKLRSTLGGPFDGTLTESMVLSEEGVVRVPAHLGDEAAATLPCAALTAWNALTGYTPVRAGDTVLVQGTGGVSIFALQLAKILGCRVIATSSSDEKLERVRALGADETLNYLSQPEWGRAARELTGGVGVDHIVEVGGSGTLTQSLRAIRIGGQISLIGVLSGNQKDLNINPIFMQAVRVQGILVGHRESFEAMIRAIALHALEPVVDRVFGFDEAPAAFDALAKSQLFGKLCVRIAT